MFLDQLIAEELLEEPMRVPSGCPVADLEGAADMGDDLRHRARPVDGVPDLGSDRVEAQDLTLFEIEQNRLFLNEAPGDLLALGKPGVYREHGCLSGESFSKNVLERSRIENSVRHPRTRRTFWYRFKAL